VNRDDPGMRATRGFASPWPRRVLRLDADGDPVDANPSPRDVARANCRSR
jgi:hypothetical protein